MTIAILVNLVENGYHQGVPQTWAENARHRLREAGYRNGPARVAVIGLLDGEDCCVSAADVQRRLEELAPS